MTKPVRQPEQVIDTLNNLIETCRDGQNGFLEAAENLENPQFKTFCNERSRERANYVTELQSEVRSLGGDPEQEGSTSAAIHRAWMDLKSSLGGGDKAILSSIESGEDSAVEQYQEALEENLPVNLRSIIERQYQEVRRSHDQVKVMRDSLK